LSTQNISRDGVSVETANFQLQARYSTTRPLHSLSFTFQFSNNSLPEISGKVLPVIDVHVAAAATAASVVASVCEDEARSRVKDVVR